MKNKKEKPPLKSQKLLKRSDWLKTESRIFLLLGKLLRLIMWCPWLRYSSKSKNRKESSPLDLKTWKECSSTISKGKIKDRKNSMLSLIPSTSFLMSSLNFEKTLRPRKNLKTDLSSCKKKSGRLSSIIKTKTSNNTMAQVGLNMSYNSWPSPQKASW